MATFNFRKFSDPDRLKRIAPALLLQLLEPWRDYLTGRDLCWRDGSNIDCDALARILIEPDANTPKGMIDALYYVHETSSDEDMDRLLELAEARHLAIAHGPQTTSVDVAIQVWLAAPDLVRERHAESIAFRQKNFLYYAGAYGKKRVFPSIGNELRLQIEAELDDWFEKHRRGRGCHVFLFPQGDKVWILVRHGLPMRREPSHHDDGHSSSEVYRPQQHDVLIYDTASDELGVHAATKGEIELYLTCFGGLVFGDESYFPTAEKFKLDPLIVDGGNSLLCEDVEGLKTIRLVEYRRYWGGAHKEIEIRKAGDIFAALGARAQQFGAGGRLVSATFKVKFTESPKERSVTIRPPGNARYERNEDSELIEVWLAKRGFMLKPKSEDDDETPSAVLEGS